MSPNLHLNLVADPGAKIRHLTARIRDMRLDLDTAFLITVVGTNDFGAWALANFPCPHPRFRNWIPKAPVSDDNVVQAFKQLIRTLREVKPDLPVFIVGILPRPVDFELAEPKRLDVNRQLEGLAFRAREEGHYITYIDPGHALLDENGIPRAHNYIDGDGEGDGLHLTGVGTWNLLRQIRRLTPRPPLPVLERQPDRLSHPPLVIFHPAQPAGRGTMRPVSHQRGAPFFRQTRALRRRTKR